MGDLREAVKACTERLDRYRRPGQRIGEQNTKIMLIEPILQALGWDLFDPEEVNREYRRRGSDNPVDYALLLLRTPRLFVEAKGLGENIDDPRWANQTISYAAVAGVEWVALTDGAQWRIYNAHAPVPVEDKLFRSVELAHDPDAAMEMLELLSKENMRENRIHELWQGYFVDRQIHGVLTGLFTGTEPPSDLVNLISKRTERLGRDDVRASLIRARATFDFPLSTLTGGQPPSPPTARPAGQPVQDVASVPAEDAFGRQQSGKDSTPFGSAPQATAPTPTPSNPTRAAKAAGSGGRTVTPEERLLKLTDLLAAGRISPGVLTARYDGQVWHADLGPDGSVSFRGKPCSSLSKAGEVVKIASRGPGLPQSVAATDGWDFWSAADAVVGDTVKLKEARRRAAQRER